MNEEQVRALIASAMNEAGFLTKTEFNSTAAMIRGMRESIESMKSNNPLDALVGAGLLEKGDDGSYKPKATAAPAKKDAEPEWKREIDALRAQNDAKDKALAAEKAKREEGELKSAVIAALDKAGAVNASRDYVHVLPHVRRAEDGTFQSIRKDEYGVESNVPLDKFFTEFLTANPELRKAQSHSGSGTPASGGNGSAGVPKSLDSLAQMSPEAYFAARKAGKL